MPRVIEERDGATGEAMAAFVYGDGIDEPWVMFADPRRRQPLRGLLLPDRRRRHDINPQAYLTQLLANLPDTPVNDVDQWLPDEWKKRLLAHFAKTIPEHA